MMQEVPQTVARAADTIIDASPILGSLLILSLAGNVLLIWLYVRSQRVINDWLMGRYRNE